MPYGTPTDPVAGTVITVAYAVANLLNPIRALRAFTGGSDPPGSNYWLRSDSTSAVSWVARAAEVIAALGYTPVNKAGDTMTGTLTMTTAANSVSAAGTITTSSVSANSIVTSGGISANNSIATAATLIGANASITSTATAAVHNGTVDVRVAGTSVLSRATHTGTQPASTISDIADVRVPDGAVVWFETLAELTAAGASWQRYTAADGRLLVGAGSSASAQTFTQATNYGSTWTPTSGVTATSATIGPSGFTALALGTGAPGTADYSHTHPAPTITLNNTGQVWLPYMRAGIWGRKI